MKTKKLLLLLKILLSISLVFGLPPVAHADHLTVDTTTSGTGVGSTSHSHTIAADANLVIVCPSQRDGANAVQPVVSVTVGGQAATFLVGVGTGTPRAEIWYKLSPLTGAQTIAATGGTGTDQMVTGAISIKNAALTSTFNTTATAGPTTSTNADVDSIASAVGELAVMCVATNAAPTCAADATSPVSTERFDVQNAGNHTGCGYTEAGAASTINMRVDLSASQQWAAAAVSIRHLSELPSGATRRRGG